MSTNKDILIQLVKDCASLLPPQRECEVCKDSDNDHYVLDLCNHLVCNRCIEDSKSVSEDTGYKCPIIDCSFKYLHTNVFPKATLSYDLRLYSFIRLCNNQQVLKWLTECLSETKREAMAMRTIELKTRRINSDFDRLNGEMLSDLNFVKTTTTRAISECLEKLKYSATQAQAHQRITTEIIARNTTAFVSSLSVTARALNNAEDIKKINFDELIQTQPVDVELGGVDPSQCVVPGAFAIKYQELRDIQEAPAKIWVAKGYLSELRELTFDTDQVKWIPSFSEQHCRTHLLETNEPTNKWKALLLSSNVLHLIGTEYVDKYSFSGMDISLVSGVKVTCRETERDAIRWTLAKATSAFKHHTDIYVCGPHDVVCVDWRGHTTVIKRLPAEQIIFIGLDRYNIFVATLWNESIRIFYAPASTTTKLVEHLGEDDRVYGLSPIKLICGFTDHSNTWKTHLGFDDAHAHIAAWQLFCMVSVSGSVLIYSGREHRIVNSWTAQKIPDSLSADVYGIYFSYDDSGGIDVYDLMGKHQLHVMTEVYATNVCFLDRERTFCYFDASERKTGFTKLHCTRV
jgi:hypothetical protein